MAAGCCLLSQPVAGVLDPDLDFEPQTVDWRLDGGGVRTLPLLLPKVQTCWLQGSSTHPEQLHKKRAHLHSALLWLRAHLDVREVAHSRLFRSCEMRPQGCAIHAQHWAPRQQRWWQPWTGYLNPTLHEWPVGVAAGLRMQARLHPAPQ